MTEEEPSVDLASTFICTHLPVHTCTYTRKHHQLHKITLKVRGQLQDQGHGKQETP